MSELTTYLITGASRGKHTTCTVYRGLSNEADVCASSLIGLGKGLLEELLSTPKSHHHCRSQGPFELWRTSSQTWRRRGKQTHRYQDRQHLGAWCGIRNQTAEDRAQHFQAWCGDCQFRYCQTCRFRSGHARLRNARPFRSQYYRTFDLVPGSVATSEQRFTPEICCHLLPRW